MSEEQEKYNVEKERVNALETELKLMRGAVELLRAGLETEWSDKALLQAFAGADTKSGPLGAVMVILRREIERATEEAETLENSGKFELLPGPVGAARRLRYVQSRLVELWQKSHGEVDAERKPRGYGI
jgi:hypothetical protein